MNNYIKLRLPALSENESFARTAVAAFTLPLSPTVEEINDVKTAVSEAITNCVVHAYAEATEPLLREILIEAELVGNNTVNITVVDFGCGIADVERAMQPFYTTKPADDRGGMGFSVMQSFMDTLTVHSVVGAGTTVLMSKRIGACDA